MSELKVKFKKMHPDAKIPVYAKPGDAGMDLTCVSVKLVENEKTGQLQYVYDTGLAFEIPEGHVGLAFPRSSVSNTTLSLSNCVGVIDAAFRGSVKAKFNVTAPKGQYVPYEAGDRIIQLMIIPYPKVILEEVDELSETERGTGGFGSTGK